jgi:hypothetical protein
MNKYYFFMFSVLKRFNSNSYFASSILHDIQAVSFGCEHLVTERRKLHGEELLRLSSSLGALNILN